MRLLRTTTTNTSGLFNSFLNQDLVIKPYSKIALGGISATVEQDVIVIGADNNTFQFSTSNTGGNPNVRQITIPEGSYDTSNFQRLLNEMNILINSSLGVFSAGPKITITNANNIGKQALISIDDKGVAQIQFDQAVSEAHHDEIVGNSYQGNIVLAAGTTEDTFRFTSSADAVNPTYSTASYFNNVMCTGVGVFRARIAKLQGSAAGGDLGFTIGIMKSNPANIIGHTHSSPLAVTDISFGIQILNPFTGKYQIIENGALLAAVDSGDINAANNVSLGTNATAFRNNDVLSIEICSGQIRLVVYQNDPGAPNAPHTRVLKSFPYTGTDAVDYYGMIALHGSSSNLNISSVKFTANPYLEPEVNRIFGEDAVVGAATPGGQGTIATVSTITFPNIEFANWLGYKRISYTGASTKGLVTFAGDNRFKSSIVNDLYLVELLNIQLESYDTFEEGRKNILALVPYDDVNSKVAYDPNNLIFLDLNNRDSINLTSLKMRLVRADYSTPDLSGLTSAILYIKSKDE